MSDVVRVPVTGVAVGLDDPVTLTKRQILARLAAYQQLEINRQMKRETCFCTGAAAGEPYCPCVMRRIREQAEAVLTNRVNGELLE